MDKVHISSDQSDPESNKTRFYKLPYIRKYSEQVQKNVNSSAKAMILKLFLLTLKSITIFQLKIQHPIF